MGLAGNHVHAETGGLPSLAAELDVIRAEVLPTRRAVARHTLDRPSIDVVRGNRHELLGRLDALAALATADAASRKKLAEETHSPTSFCNPGQAVAARICSDPIHSSRARTRGCSRRSSAMPPRAVPTHSVSGEIARRAVTRLSR